jgi:hypothetical protein
VPSESLDFDPVGNNDGDRAKKRSPEPKLKHAVGAITAKFKENKDDETSIGANPLSVF